MTDISDYDLGMLRVKYMEREANKLNRRSSPRVERPVDIKPSAPGNRIVTWNQYLELVEQKQAHYPPKPFGHRP